MGRRRRRARGQRSRLLSPRRGERRRRVRERSPRQAALGREPPRRGGRVHGSCSRLAPVGADQRPGVRAATLAADTSTGARIGVVIGRVCIVGAGTIGSLFAGHLAQVVDVCVLTRRREHAQALDEHGLRVTGRTELTARLDATADPSALPQFDLGIVCCKGTDLETVAASLEGRAAQATLMTVQNGLGAEDVVRRHGDWPLISAITFMSGTRHSDTEVEYILDAATWLGPYEETPLARVREVEALIRSSGLRAQAFEDLRPAQWSKLVFNATVNGVAALTGLPHDFHFGSEAEPTDLGRLVHALMEEGTAVAQAAGPGTADDPWEMNVHATGRGSGHYPSMLEDVNAERPTEVESINGALVREAERLGVEIPLQRSLYALVRAREASYS
ncbi:MAG: ketopantoate reductase family protein [Actinobacteria bacterium]|nr:MAG: ketopantoate reductase family protein [Actinomycetota bacterium]